MARTPDRSLAVAGSLAALGLFSACSLTGPLDGYAEGDPPSQPDAGQDVSSDTQPDQDCPSGYADCDGDEANGCETELATDPDHCGTCDQPCAVDNGNAACVLGNCQVASCFDGFGDCDQDPLTGCETDTTSSAMDCGTCGNECLYDNAVGVCSANTCSMGECNIDYADCDDSDANGCETNTSTSVDHCGTCLNACELRPNSSPSCEEGQCGLLCDADYGDCDAEPTNGCETDLQTDVLHCASCDNACSTEHAAASCVASQCLLTCDQDYADCDDDVSTGCEVSLLTDPDHCNACETVCTIPAGAASTCDAGVCGFICNAGVGDCNVDPLDGCESDLLSDPLQCGACGRSCLGGDCIDGKCDVEELAAGLNRPSGIVLDSNHVYWTDAADNYVYRVSKSGGPKDLLTTGGATGPIVRDGLTLYWTTGAVIARMSTSGAGKQTVVTGETYITDLTHDGSDLFWLRRGSFSGSTYNNDGEVARAPMSGGAAVKLVSDQRRPRALAVDGSYVYWANEGTYTGTLYNGDGSVLRVAKTGGTITTVATNQAKPCGIAVDATTIYWTNCGSGVVMTKEKSGGAPREFLSGQHLSGGLRLDGAELFWPYMGADPDLPTGDVRKAMIAPPSVLVLADAQIQPYRVAVDATHVYWLNFGGGDEEDIPPGNGGVMRVPR